MNRHAPSIQLIFAVTHHAHAIGFLVAFALSVLLAFRGAGALVEDAFSAADRVVPAHGLLRAHGRLTASQDCSSLAGWASASRASRTAA